MTVIGLDRLLDITECIQVLVFLDLKQATIIERLGLIGFYLNTSGKISLRTGVIGKLVFCQSAVKI